MSDNNSDWKEAENYLKDLKEAYEDIGIVGTFGLICIDELSQRFEAGERTDELYSEIMELE